MSGPLQEVHTPSETRLHLVMNTSLLHLFLHVGLFSDSRCISLRTFTELKTLGTVRTLSVNTSMTNLTSRNEF